VCGDVEEGARVRAVRFHDYGGPEALRVDDVPVPAPGAGQVLLELDAVGVTLPVVRLARGRPQGGGVTLPHAPGGDVVGRVAGLGAGVTGWRIGQRAAGPAFAGGYAEYAVVAVPVLAAVPDDVDDHTAVTAVRGGQVALGALGASGLLEGESVLVTAAAGATGQLAVQLAAVLRAGRVAGAVGPGASRRKIEALHALGVAEVLGYHELGELAPVDVVLDGVGGDVQARALDTLAPFGRLVTFSAEGGPVDANGLRVHSRTVIGFNMSHFATRRTDAYLANRERLWRLTGAGRLRAPVDRVLPLDAAGQAHRLIEDRCNVGKLVLLPRREPAPPATGPSDG
jgi:NADPH:quinone reductase-like Zn-dependent oxidoreductase